MKTPIRAIALSFLFLANTLWAPPQSLSPMQEAIHWGIEYKQADTELNKVYRQLLGSRSPEGQKKLRVAQHAWIVFRDAEAEFVRQDWEGGSGQAAAVNSTLAVLTRDRIRQLKERF
jgi:uncharacterized protein YecT (DUF1311 family)